MKKFGIIALAALLVVAFTIPAAALESTFGGYWRTRFFSQSDFSGDDSESQDYNAIDTRSRLYATFKKVFRTCCQAGSPWKTRLS
ncbi:unnamed protein product [marine sediment metagenome]|uniref:Uncharacterized protein n=1 Tax=marine sediment metagenome TaxID=412755 RepID=X1BMA7_9ZZZZ